VTVHRQIKESTAVFYKEFCETNKYYDIEQCLNIEGTMVQKLQQMVKKWVANQTDTTTDFRFYSSLYNIKFHVFYISF
jgi:hypothetical protein